MTHWASIRAKAREMHNRLAAAAGNDHDPAAVLSAADTATQHQRIPVAAGDPLLFGAEAALHGGFVWFNADLEPWVIYFNQAHEYAHLWLHGSSIHACLDCEFDSEATEDHNPIGVERVEGYGPHQRRELEANVFARELLLPSDLLRTMFLTQGLTAAGIAERMRIPSAIVFHQLAMALFAPNATDAPRAAVPEPPLDESQREAAFYDAGPLLVEAGPGTGKTRTLVGRVVWLLEEKHIVPEAILALTFSNKAAEEMQSRVARVSPEKALSIWTGTFHGFGLEILRRFGDRIGFTKTPTVIDPVDALYLLEQSLDRLGLDYYRDLIEPSKFLPAILSVISRAKDELAGSAEYQAAAEEMRRGAQTQAEIETAEKAMEVAGVFRVYEEELQEQGMLDYGDLLRRSVLLLQSDAEVRNVMRSQYPHIVVDEYQDVNTASRLLLKELAGDGRGLWVVGDQLQAIYRFRGAAPINMNLFTIDFTEGRVVPLRINYRSQKHVVKTFSTFGSSIKSGQGKFLAWKANRTDTTGRIAYEVADDEQSEASGIADEIERQHVAGVSYKNQAILCRTHSGLAKLCSTLESRGIPIFYLGDLFEREEIRELLSVLSLASERKGSGLICISRFPEYEISPGDVLNLLKKARDEELYFPKALELAEVSSEISDPAKSSFGMIAKHLDGISYGTSAWTTLSEYLFSRSKYARDLSQDDSVKGSQKRIAIYQLLQFAHRMRNHLTRHGEDPKRAFLDYIRRLELYGQERQLRQPPIWASEVDAVRMLTVHASKGLEFSAVYLPQLGKGRTPLKVQAASCTVPPQLVPESVRDWHHEEEECLFFVALSRARDTLWVSRAARYGKQNSNPSDFLYAIQARLPRDANVEPTLPKVVSTDVVPGRTATVGSSVRATNRELETYMRCPQQYHFDSVLALGGRRTNTAYVQFHVCVYRTLAWIANEESKGGEIRFETAVEVLDVAWEESGPAGHVYEKFYRREAERFLRDAIARVTTSPGKTPDADWEIHISNGVVTTKPDRVIVLQSSKEMSVVVQKWRTGKPPKKFQPEDTFGLYVEGARGAFPGAKIKVEVLYLSTNETRDGTPTPEAIAKSLEKYNDAMSGILRKRFDAVPSEWYCPRCPHYFICPAPAFVDFNGPHPLTKARNEN